MELLVSISDFLLAVPKEGNEESLPILKDTFDVLFLKGGVKSGTLVMDDWDDTRLTNPAFVGLELRLELVSYFVGLNFLGLGNLGGRDGIFDCCCEMILTPPVAETVLPVLALGDGLRISGIGADELFPSTLMVFLI